MFASLFRADGNVDDRSPFGDFYFQKVGRASASGQRVDSDSAMRLAAVFGCVRVLSEAMGVLPFRLYRPKVGGGRLRVTDHWLVRLFSRRPNVFQNWFEWRMMLQGHLVLRGNAYCRITQDGLGGIASLTPIHPDRIRAETLASGEWRYLITRLDGTQEYLPREDVFHLRSLSNDGISGISPVEAARDVLGAALGAQDFSARFWQNDGKPTGGWLEFPGKIPNEGAKDKLKDSIRKAISGANQHRMLVLDQGMKYHEVGLSNRDSQFIEARKFSRDEICGIFRVPPHMIANLERATFSNIEQQGIDFWQNSMLSWVTLWEAAAEALLGEEGEALEYEVDFDMRAMMRGDSASRSAYLNSGVINGWLSRNEAREAEGLDPKTGLDEFLVPVNERNLSDPSPSAVPDGAAPAAPVEPDEDDAPAPKKKGAERLEAFERSASERMARRIASGDVPKASTLADALAVPEGRAVAWLAGNPEAPTWPAETITASLRALCTEHDE